MKNSEPNLEALQALLQASDLQRSENADMMINIASSINDEEDKDLALFKVSEALAVATQLDKAYAAAQLIISHRDRAEAFLKIARQLFSTGQTDRSLSFLGEALSVANQVEEPWQKAELLYLIAQLLTEVKGYADAWEIWERAITIAKAGEGSSDIQSSIDCSSVICEIAEGLASVGAITKAREVANSIRSLGKRQRALEAIEAIERMSSE